MARELSAKAKIAKADKEWRARMREKGRHLDRDGRILPATPYSDHPLREFWEAVDKDLMNQALCESGDERAVNLASILMTPGRRNLSFAAACRESGVTLQQLNDLWRKHNLAVGMVKMATHLPKVMEDVAVDAQSTYVVCPRCDGLGQITRAIRAKSGAVVETDTLCPQCKGAREIRQPGDKSARDLTFKAVGLVKETPTVAIQQNFEGFESTMIDAQKVLQPVRHTEEEDS